MQPLAKSQWSIDRPKNGGDFVIVGAHEHLGYIHYTKFALSDLPNDFVGLDDLERIGIVGRVHEPAV